MGRGRNGIWLASAGWDVTGYDISADALEVAQAYAKQAGVKVKTTVSSHEEFDFGDLWENNEAFIVHKLRNYGVRFR